MPSGRTLPSETLVRQLPSGGSSGVFSHRLFSFVIVVFVQPNTPYFFDRLVSADSSFCTVVLIHFLSPNIQNYFHTQTQQNNDLQPT